MLQKYQKHIQAHYVMYGLEVIVAALERLMAKLRMVVGFPPPQMVREQKQTATAFYLLLKAVVFAHKARHPARPPQLKN
ncbi:hypothetical protein GPALN_013359 [Globodera pallida]|nr:hypothetical protein GPALN_013359 [Globodera pallida]